MLPYTKTQYLMSNPVTESREYEWVMNDLTRIPTREGMAVHPQYRGVDLCAADGELAAPVFYSCRHYDPVENRCTDYDNRPEVCSGFPFYDHPRFMREAALLPPSCSFNADLGRGSSGADPMTEAMICGTGRDWPDAGEGACCIGAAMFGPDRCTCWEPVYDMEQVTPDLTIPGTGRADMCADCAFRPDSPERNGADGYAHNDPDELDRIVGPAGGVFFCHQGIRRPIKWVHPSGAEVAGSPSNYDPPIVKNVPFKADGTPADICHGFLVRRLKALQT